MEGGHSLLERLLHDKNAEPTDMSLSLLKSITNNFADALKIGCGGFAVVYKGELKNGEIVAVKKLSNSICMDENKYNQEVSCLMRVKHRNVVRFLGYCADTQGKMVDYGGKFVMADVRERLLCFEYVPNGTLKDYITDASNGLEWRKCYQIIKGISEGLHYLHELRIVHLDLKPANILLDDNMVPKIADFGISRCFDQEQSWAIATKLVGTPGYLAPESYTRKITTKLDMYSLGVIIIEILTGQKGYSSVENVLESWRNRLKTSSAIDTVLKQIRVCFEISIDCMDFNPGKRPTARRIIELLEQTERMDQFNETEMQDIRQESQFQRATSSNFSRNPDSGNRVVEVESALRHKARPERHQRTAERVTKALAEKNMRDVLAQREQAEKHRLSEFLDAEIKRWSNGKEGNLRFLLATLQYILGADSGWQPVPLTDLITAVAVKKAYRKATLCVHPDKLQQRGATIRQKYICDKVFDLLKDAWNKFTSEER